MRGTEVFIRLVGEAISPVLPQILASLSQPVRDDEAEVRVLAERCCESLGECVEPRESIDMLIPRIAGEVSGGDTSSHRKSQPLELKSFVQYSYFNVF